MKCIHVNLFHIGDLQALKISLTALADDLIYGAYACHGLRNDAQLMLSSVEVQSLSAFTCALLDRQQSSVLKLALPRSSRVCHDKSKLNGMERILGGILVSFCEESFGSPLRWELSRQTVFLHPIAQLPALCSTLSNIHTHTHTHTHIYIYPDEVPEIVISSLSVASSLSALISGDCSPHARYGACESEPEVTSFGVAEPRSSSL